MQREDRLDVLPLTNFRRDTSATFVFGPVDEMENGKDILRFEVAVDDGILCASRVCLGDTVKPIFDPITLLK